MRVSSPVAAHSYGRTQQNKFGGIVHKLGAGEGEIYSMLNVTGDYYPLLASREVGWRKSLKPAGVGQAGYIYAYKTVDGHEVWVYKSTENTDTFYVKAPDGKISSKIFTDYTSVERTVVEIEGKICVYPDRYVYDCATENANSYTTVAGIPATENVEGNCVLIGAEGETKQLYRYWINMWRSTNPIMPMAAYYSGTFSIEDGTFEGVAAEKNTIKIALPNVTNRFFPEVGDAVTVWKGQLGREKTVIIREMAADNNYLYLRFYEGTFSAVSSETGIIEREVPELSSVCEHKNRLWGYKGKSIYCSKQGNPLNWRDYDSLADGAWSVDIGDGVFTGCFSYNYPLFFTEDKIYSVLGDTPAEYSLSVTPNTFGLAEGSHKSLAIVRGYLFYHSPYGFAYYYGSMPYLCSEDLGNEYYYEAVGGGKGDKYYVSCLDSLQTAHTFVYDTKLKTWHEEMNAFNKKVVAYDWDGDLYAAQGDGVYTVGIPRNKPSSTSEYGANAMPSVVQFAPMYRDTLNKKQVKSVLIRHEVTGTLTVKVFVDGVENQSLRKTVTGTGMTEIVGIPKRGDSFYLRLEGSGTWRVYSIGYDYYEGSELK